ncbi:glycosyltransferase family 4 protein [Flavobacterium phragmitis]|uniref:Glycosyltransferase involved in cell wall bisynthesis n=1 Tax=Flavobacterium phragmitis TaxID=739143 RepID=A0A1I1K4Y1_9FLAO|nr:glycosyltransferase family 1 protein [Flavobacterium phragmitis]SFC56009.1 Glycosyltransferase involved in cell wall bisynthesis [Flavobacterium phragmitis]
MKLVIDIRLINASGIGTYIKNVIPDIISEFKTVTVLGNKNEIEKFDWSRKVEIVEFNSKMYSLTGQLLYPFKIPQCDVFWCPHFNFPIFPIRAKKKAVTIHDVNHLTGISPISSLKKKYASFLYKNAVRKADVIFTVSEFSKKEIVHYTIAELEKVKVVYCGVDIPFFEEEKQSNIELPKDFLLYIGNIKPHKNLIVLLQAYNSLNSSLKEKYKLLIVGKKEGFITGDNQIEEYIKTNNLEKNIIFSGWIQDQDLPVYYQKASLFVFPSLYEGFGLPILESLAAKTPVISSSAASLPEIGSNLVEYFDPNNDKELAQKIMNVLKNPGFNNQVSGSLKTHLEKFTWEKSIKKHLQGFYDILYLINKK